MHHVGVHKGLFLPPYVGNASYILVGIRRPLPPRPPYAFKARKCRRCIARDARRLVVPLSLCGSAQPGINCRSVNRLLLAVHGTLARLAIR